MRAKQKGKLLLWHPRENKRVFRKGGGRKNFDRGTVFCRKEIINLDLVPKCINMNNNIVLGTIFNVLSERP